MMKAVDFKKGDGLIPAVIQDARTGVVLMLGYMNEEALQATEESGRVTFFSRSKQRLWTKGESSGHYLYVKQIRADCDQDALLITATPVGPTCHEGTQSCFGGEYQSDLGFLAALEDTISQRQSEADPASSYTAKLFARGTDAMAQKVGEEAVEVVIEAKNGNRERLIEESSDLLFHLLVLLRSQGIGLGDVVGCLAERGGGEGSTVI